MKTTKKTRDYLAGKINRELKSYFSKKISELRGKNGFFVDITKDLAEYTLRGGKRIRPIFMIYGYEAITGEITDNIVKLSIFLELIQSSLLIHDDIMDQDELRRGGVTIHERYNRYFKMYDRNFGESIAIIIGDLAMNFAYEIIAESALNAKTKVKLISLVSRYISKVDYGQSVDVKLSKLKKYSKQDIRCVHYYKTMIYTTMMPLVVGVTIGGADKKQLKYISQYAENTGLAFQVQDDIMGIFGEEKEIGKPIGSDLSEHKKTLLILKAIESASSADKKVIGNVLGKEKITKIQLEKVREIIVQTGSFDYSKKLAEKFIDEAIGSINKANISKSSKDKFINIAQYIITRKE